MLRKRQTHRQLRYLCSGPEQVWGAFAHVGVRSSWREGKPADCRILDLEQLARSIFVDNLRARWLTTQRLGESFSIHGAGRHWGRSRTTLLGRAQETRGPASLQAWARQKSTTCLFRTAPKHGRGLWWRRRSVLRQIWFPIAGTAMWNATSSR
jgi:hypothetical protein